MPDKITIHMDYNKVREDISPVQLEKCPHCGGPLIDGFGLAGGGYGIYQYCEPCERVVFKLDVGE